MSSLREVVRMDVREMVRKSGARHPWETARAAFFVRLLERHGALRGAPRVLDVGAGDGFVASRLVFTAPAAHVIALDTSYDESQLSALNEQSPGGERLRFVSREPDEAFDLLLLLDVVEHVEDDAAFLAQLVARRLAPTGHALVSVPAWPALYTQHDVSLGHYRRYRPQDLARLLAEAGLRILARGEIFHVPLVIRTLQKLVELANGVRSSPAAAGFGRLERAQGVTAWRRGRLSTALLQGLLQGDNALPKIRGFELPGLSCYALCERS